MLASILAASASGVLYFLGFTGFGYWPLIFVFLVPMFVAVEGRRDLAAFGIGEIAGTVAMYGGFYWVAHLLQLFADLSAPLAFLGLTLLCVYNGGTLGLEAWLYVRMRRRGWHPALCGAVAMTAVEATYPLLFPNYAANALFRVPLLTQPIELFGMAALGVLVGGVNGALAGAWLAREERPRMLGQLGVAAAMLGLFAVYGAVRIPMVDAASKAAAHMKVALIQANHGAASDVSRAEQSKDHRRMTREVYRAHPDLDLVVWPESGYGGAVLRKQEDLLAVTGGTPVPVALGVTTVEFPPEGRRRTWNSAVLTSTTGERIGLYDKVELLMFGEGLPFEGTFPILREWFPQAASFQRGQRFEHLVHPSGIRMMALICYEDLLPGLVRRLWKKAGPADVLLNLTNDSWYGDTHEPLTHLALATFRTIETRRAMIRSTNTGISAFVDPVGRITDQTPQYARATLVGEVPVLEGGPTLYVRWGNVLGWTAIACALFAVFWPRR
jgi:apolipoprotein N-acyltransferase